MLNGTNVILILCKCQIKTNLDLGKERLYSKVFCNKENDSTVVSAGFSKVKQKGLFAYKKEQTRLARTGCGEVVNTWHD